MEEDLMEQFDRLKAALDRQLLPSRAASIAHTNLDTAKLWAKQSLDERKTEG